MEPLTSNRISWASIVSTLALGGLLLLTNGCNDASLVSVGFSTGTAPAGEEIPTPTPDPDGDPDGTPTPMPTPTDDPDNPDDPGDPTPTPTASPSPSPTPSLACGTVVIRDLRIKTDDSSGPSISYRPWAELDLTDPNASTINGLGVSPGTYTRVRFTVHKRTGSGSGGPGTGNPEVNHSIHLCGEWNGIAWDYKDDETFDIDRRDEGGVVVDGDGPAKLFVIFDSAHWFDGIDLTQWPAAPDGVVYMDHHVNAELQRRFRDNFRDSVRLANEAHGSH